MRSWKHRLAAFLVLCGLAMPSAFAQCENGFANCWHCARNTCWAQAGNVSYFETLYSWYCNLSWSYGCGLGECDQFYLEVTSVCDGTCYGNWGYFCCDL